METGSSARMMLRLEDQRARHHDALTLAAAQLVRIAAQRLLRAQPDRLQRLLDHVPLLSLDLASFR